MPSIWLINSISLNKEDYHYSWWTRDCFRPWRACFGWCDSRLSAGDQNPSDAVVLEGFASEVNEAMLTGESDLVQKKVEDLMLSGSFLASGSVLAQVHHVGADNYAAKLMLELRPLNRSIPVSWNHLINLQALLGKSSFHLELPLLEALVLKKVYH